MQETQSDTGEEIPRMNAPPARSIGRLTLPEEQAGPNPSKPADMAPHLQELDRAWQHAADNGRVPLVLALPERFALYLAQRAAAHGETPERHAETIIRRFWQNDEWRAMQQATAPTQPGDPAGTVRKR